MGIRLSGLDVAISYSRVLYLSSILHKNFWLILKRMFDADRVVAINERSYHASSTSTPVSFVATVIYIPPLPKRL